MDSESLPLVSVVVPIYNSEKHLRCCVKAIEEQYYHHIEIILIDDGSCDGSSKICDELACNEKNIKVIHQKNMGPGSARNKGIEYSKGKYIVFIDSDDSFDSQIIKEFVSVMEEYKLDLAICGFRKIYVDKKDKKIVPRKGLYQKKEDFLKNFVDLDQQNLIASVCNKMYRRSVLVRKNISFNTIFMGEDFLFNLEYIKFAESFYLIDQALYHYHIGCKSLSTGYRPNEFDKRKLNIDKYKEFIYQNNLSKEFVDIGYMRMAFSSMMNLHNPNNKDSYLQKIQEIKKILNDDAIIRAIKYAKTKGMVNKCILGFFRIKSPFVLFIVTYAANNLIEKR